MAGSYYWRTIMPKFDIVYILKEELDTEELIYSLRSIEANFPHGKVWFVGGQPQGLTPDVAFKHKQVGESKWDLIRSSMLKVVGSEELTDKFFLFNDDFFVMKPFKGEFVNFVDGSLTERIEELRKLNPWLNPYARTLYKAREELKSLGYGERNFDVHLPMLFTKEKVKEAINKCSSPQMRSIYGNITQEPCIEHKDVKVYDMNLVPEDMDFLSTNDDTFKKGKVGEYIRGVFSSPCKYETPTPKGVHL